MSKNVGVLFSGGLDSTYLVYKNLKEGNVVTPIYVEIRNNVDKTILEKNRIELLYNKLDIEFNLSYPRKLNRIRYVLNVGVEANESGLYFKQVPIWILAALFCQGLDVEEIQIGYVSNDDAISYIKDIKKIYQSYGVICDKLIPLKFPITKMKKFQIADALPEQYLDLVVSCENPRLGNINAKGIHEYVPCCTCTPCETIMSTRYFGKNFPKIYDDKILDNKILSLLNMGYSLVSPDGTSLKTEKDMYHDFMRSCDGTQLKLDFVFDESCAPIQCIPEAFNYRENDYNDCKVEYTSTKKD